MFLTFFFPHKGSLINHKARNLCKLHRKQLKMTPPSGLFLFADDHNHHHRRHYYYNYQNYYYYYYHYYHYHNYVLTNKTKGLFFLLKNPWLRAGKGSHKMVIILQSVITSLLTLSQTNPGFYVSAVQVF